MPTDLNVRFNKDKAFLIEQTKEFLKDKNRFSEPLTATREDVAKAVGEGNFTEALQNLEILREKQAGIKLIKIEGKDGNSPIIIRDGCENPNDSRILGTEGFEMQYLNAIRASIDLAKIEGKLGLEENLKKQAVDFINNFHDKNIGNPLQDVSSKKAQTNISANMKTEIDNLAELLGKNGIKDAYKKLNVAKDFQNFNDEHCNIVTLSKITNEQGKSYTAIEAEVALKGLTETQKQEYQNRADKKWFKKIPPWERALVNKYAEKIKEGNHVIPTQLRQIVGVKNAFEKVGAIAEMDGTDFNIFQSEKHAGTIASLSKDKGSRQEITNLNAGQLQEWIGKDKILHTNTLNSGPIGAGNDPEIVSSTIKSMESVGGQNTNTAFNLARLFGGANNFSGVKNTLEQTIVNLKLLEEDSEKLKTHIKPRGRISRLFGINKPKGDAEEIIANLRLSKKIDDKTVKILRDAVKLRKDVEKADVPFRGFLDKENINLKISTSLNILTQQIALKVKKGVDEIIVMCASGKDRTGLLLHNLFAQALSSVTDVPIKDLDKQILKNGHTAEQAGSIFAGGGTIGCYGTKTENKQGIPESRKDSLSSIMEVTAKTNKIEGDSKKTDKEYAKNHPKESVKAPVVKPKSKGTNKPTPQLKPSITPAATLGVKNEREMRK